MNKTTPTAQKHAYKLAMRLQERCKEIEKNNAFEQAMKKLFKED